MSNEVLSPADRDILRDVLQSVDSPMRARAADLFLRIASRIGELEGRLQATESTALWFDSYLEKLGAPDVPKVRTVHLSRPFLARAYCDTGEPNAVLVDDPMAATCIECKRLHLDAIGAAEVSKDRKRVAGQL